MPEVVIGLTITTRTPLSIGAGGSSGTIVDKSILRDGWGRPIIPGSQVKGKARHTAEALARALGYHVASSLDEVDGTCIIRSIFGAPGGLKVRAPLVFGDLPLFEPGVKLDDPATKERSGLRTGYVRPSVSINRQRGIAEDARLLFQETTADSVSFHNDRAIVGKLALERDLVLLLTALHLTTRWGGAKSRGLGWVKVEITATWGGTSFDKESLKAQIGALEEKS